MLIQKQKNSENFSFTYLLILRKKTLLAMVVLTKYSEIPLDDENLTEENLI